MNIYRIAKRTFIQDLSGEGARLYGGRWNKRGSSVLYTASSRALATVEYLVHLPMAIAPKDLCIVELSIPEHIECQQINMADLPEDWMSHPAPLALMDMGEAWLKSASTLLLKVPSAVVKNEWNILVNPKHPQFDQIQVGEIESYQFDKRLLK